MTSPFRDDLGYGWIAPANLFPSRRRLCSGDRSPVFTRSYQASLRIPKIHLSPIIPTHPSHFPVSPILPTLTRTPGGGGYYLSARHLCLNTLFSALTKRHSLPAGRTQRQRVPSRKSPVTSLPHPSLHFRPALRYSGTTVSRQPDLVNL